MAAGNNRKRKAIAKPGEVKTSPSARSGNSNRTKSAWLLAVVMLAQMVMVGAAIAQTQPAYPDANQQQGNSGSQVSGQAANTQNTVPNPYIDAPAFVPAVNDSSNVNVQGGGNQYGSTQGIQYNVNQLLKRDNPYGTVDSQPVQPAVFIPGGNINGQTGQQFQQGMQYQQQLGAYNTSLIMQSAEQNGMGNPQGSVNNVLSQGLGTINDTYRGMHQWFNDDIIGNLFSQIGQLIGKWISETINGWIADTVQFLAAFLRVFVLNPNIAVNGLNGSQNDGISPYIRQGADVMYGIAVDLLLLLFILAIWKYWAEAAWRGAGNLMGAVGRLIFTAGLMLVFPTIYAFEIQITNEMIKAIYFNSSDQIMMLDSALASAVRGGILAGVGGLASAFAPLLGGIGLGIAGGLVGEVFAFAGLVIFLILGGILIAELIYILVLKAIQTALLTAQYMFAPMFLVFFATPDTENVCSGFLKAWVETSLWTFVWVGLLKILVIIMFSDYNPWGKILMAVGVLQMMIQVPTFLARAQISPMSDFVSAGLITGGLMKMFGWMGKTASSRLQQGLGYYLNDRIGQQGFAQTSKNAVGGLPGQTGPGYDKLKSLRDKLKADDPNKPPGAPGQGQNLKNKADRAGLKTDEKGNPIDPATGKPINRDENGNLIDPATGKPMTAERMAALGLSGPPKMNKAMAAAAMGAAAGAGMGGFGRDKDGNALDPSGNKVLDPTTKQPLKADDKGNLIDPKTNKPLSPEQMAAMGIKSPPKLGAPGSAGGPQRTADGKLIDPATGNQLNTDKDGNLKDPTTGKTYKVDQDGNLVDQNGKKLDASQRAAVLGNIQSLGRGPQAQQQGAAGQQGAGGKDDITKPLEGLQFKQGFKPTQDQMDKYLSLVRGGAGKAAAAAAAFGAAAAVTGAAANLNGIANEQQKDQQQQDPRQKAQEEKVALNEEAAGKQVNQGQGKTQVKSEGDGKGQQGQGSSEPKGMTLPSGVSLKQGFTPSAGETAAYLSLLKKGVSPAKAAAQAFGAQNVHPDSLRDGQGPPDMRTQQQQQQAQVDQQDPTQQGQGGKGSPQVKTEGDKNQPGTQGGQQGQGVTLNSGIQLKAGFNPSAAETATYLSLLNKGVSPAKAATQAFGAQNINPDSLRTATTGNAPPDMRTQQTGQLDQQQDPTAATKGGSPQVKTDGQGADGKPTTTGAGQQGTTLQSGVQLKAGFNPSANETANYLTLLSRGVAPAAAAAQAFGAHNINPESLRGAQSPPTMNTGAQQNQTAQLDQQNDPTQAARTGQPQVKTDGQGADGKPTTTPGAGQQGTTLQSGVQLKAGFNPTATETANYLTLLSRGIAPAAAATQAFGAHNINPESLRGTQAPPAMQTGQNQTAQLDHQQDPTQAGRTAGQPQVRTEGGTTATPGAGQGMSLPSGVQFRAGFNPTANETAAYFTLLNKGVAPASAAAQAFGANNLSAETLRAANTPPAMNTGTSQTAHVEHDGAAGARTAGQPQVRTDGSVPNTQIGNNTGMQLPGGVAFKGNFAPTSTEAQHYVALINRGVNPTAAAAQAFGAQNLQTVPPTQGGPGGQNMQTIQATQEVTQTPGGAAQAQVHTAMGPQQNATTPGMQTGGQQQVNLPGQQTTMQQQANVQLQQQQQAGGHGMQTPNLQAMGLNTNAQAAAPHQIARFNWLVSQNVPPAMAAAIALDPATAAAGGGGAGGGGGTVAGGGAAGGGGGGAGNPPMSSEEAFKRVSHLQNPTVRDLDQSGLWMVAGARNPVGDVRSLKLQVRQGDAEGAGKVWGTTRGGYSRIDMPANATPAQVASMFAIAGYSNEIENDPAAMDAARVAAVQMGAHKPQGFVQGLAANINSYYGGTWASTGLGKQQFQNSMFSAAVEGSRGYVTGSGGNAYTEYLRTRYGPFDQDRMDTLTLISTDPEAAESAWNAGITQATDRLIASGTKISAANRGAALNPYVASLRPAAAGSAIRAMVLYGMHDSRMSGMDVNSGEGGMMLGEILRSMNPEEARAVHETFLQTGGADLSENIVGSVTNLAVQNGAPAGVAYKALSSNIGNVAAQLTGNNAFRSAENFDQVHQIATSTYGGAVGTQMYDQVVRVANARAQAGMQTVGRLVVDEEVSGVMDDAMGQIGGWATLSDPNNVVARDNAQMMANAVGITVNRLGAHGASASRAHAVYRYMADGNQGANSLSAQEIVIAERLVGMGAPRISQSMVQVLRNLDSEGTQNVDLTTVQDIAGNVDAGNARADQAYAVNLVRNAGYKVSRPMVEIAASLDSMDAYTPENFKVVANLVSSGVVTQASSAPTVFTTAVAKVARDANIDVNQPLNQVLSQLESTSGGATNAGSIAASIGAVKVAGGFEDRQLVDPVLFEAAYDALNDPSVSSHRVQSIRIAERIHGHGAIKDSGVVSVYDDMLEAGVDPSDLTDDYVGLQRFYAGAALRDARSSYGVPAGKNAPTPSTRMLDRIRTDPRFVMRNARPNNPPKMSQSLFNDLLDRL